MPFREVTHLKRWMLVLPYVVVVLSATFQTWRAEERAHQQVHADCVQSQHNWTQWNATATRIVEQTKASPRATPQAIKGSEDFAGFLNKLNGPKPDC